MMPTIVRIFQYVRVDGFGAEDGDDVLAVKRDEECPSRVNAGGQEDKQNSKYVHLRGTTWGTGEWARRRKIACP